jgi:hypothetical protein
MLLYYCTICALYPSLFTRGLPSSCLISSDSDQNEDDEDLKNVNSDLNNGAELETTSEGLCDHVRFLKLEKNFKFFNLKIIFLG